MDESNRIINVKMIKVVHTVHAFTAESGGTSTCTYDLLTALNNTGIQANVIVTTPRKQDVPLMGYGEKWIIPVENDEKTPFCISSHLHDALEQTDADIYHTNGLWRYCNHVVATIARKKGKPYVITPHGMLYPQALARSKWQKRLLRKVFFDKDLQEAACIHVTCEDEMRYVRALGFTNPIAVIANPVPMPHICFPKRKGNVKFGYLGRLHPRKHVERIIEALALLSREEQAQCELVLMGSGDAAYELLLRQRAEQYGLNNVQFTGFVSGQEKEKQLAGLSALFVPSDFENFGMIIAEALACGTPVFASTGTPWKILAEQECGWWQEPTAENIADVMRQILAMSPKNIDEMGEKGRMLVEESFSAERVAQQMAVLYQWIVIGKSKPSFVYE